MKKTGLVVACLALLALVSAVAIPITVANAASQNTVKHIRLNTANRKGTKMSQATIDKINAKRTAIQNAISANDYNAWVNAVGTSTPIAQKINAGNFSQLVQVYNLEKQAHDIMTSLGINNLSFGRFGLK